MAVGGCDACGDGGQRPLLSTQAKPSPATGRGSSYTRGTGGSWLIRLWEEELVQQSLVTRVAGFIFSINFL